MKRTASEAGFFDFESPKPKRARATASLPSKERLKRKPTSKTLLPTPQQKTGLLENRIICGIDYGATFSGIAFTRTANGDPTKVIVVTRWPGPIPGHFEKVPSCIALASENEFGANSSIDKWGNEVMPEHKSYRWTKMLLDIATRSTSYDSTTLSEHVRKGLLELPNGMTAEDIAERFLRHLYEHALDRMRTAYSAEIIEVNRIEFLLTVPATWSAAAVDATERAASRAGFGQREQDTLLIIREPEAAAIASLTQAIDENPDLYKKGMNVLVADLGGGTVDLQCSKIERLKPLKMSDAVTGAGGKCGSVSIDSEFCRWMERVFGHDYTNLPSSRIGTGSDFMNQFELVKQAFDGSDLTKEVNIHLIALGHALSESGRTVDEYDPHDFLVKLTRHEIKAMFDPVVEKTLALIEEQRSSLEKQGSKPIRVICLCGGLGNSPYVSLRVQEYMSENLPKCQLITDHRAWSSVVRGAAIRGLQGAVVSSRVAPHHIGIGVHRKFEPGIDNDKDAFTDELRNKRARGYIQWIVHKGQRFDNKMECAVKLYESIDPNWDDAKKRFRWVLYRCSDEHPPHRREQPGVDELARIDLDLSAAYPKPKVKSKGRARVTTELAPCKILIKLSDEPGKLAVLARHKRKEVGTAEIEYSRLDNDSQMGEVAFDDPSSDNVASLTPRADSEPR